MLVSRERLQEMIDLLYSMSKGNKLPADGLGLYIGDGLPRGLPCGPNANHLRSNELLEVCGQLLVWVDLTESQLRINKLLEQMRTGVF